MTPHIEDCIAAIASAPGGSARGIVRLSGVHTADIVARVFRAPTPFDPHAAGKARCAEGHVALPSPAIALPCRLYFWPGRRSYTGQPSAEFHAPGSPPLLECLLDALRQAGARLAEPGEFTLRAFLAGRIDLTQAEAVLGVIDARSDGELRTALDQLAGGLGGPLNALRDELLDLLAHLEAGLDFAEEAIEFITREELLAQLAHAEAGVGAIAARLRGRDADASLPRVVLVGPPNAGKSSLFNALVGGGRAITSDAPGTTRDYLTASLDLGGVSCEVIDTAGFDAAAAAPPEAAAQRQAAAARERADVEIACGDAPTVDRREACQVIRVRTKCDLAQMKVDEPDVIATSSVTGQGLAELRAALRAAIVGIEHDRSTSVRATAVRCRGSLDEAVAAIHRAQAIAAAASGEELVAAELRVALHALGEVVGAVYTDDLLDRVFSRFCIGK